MFRKNRVYILFFAGLVVVFYFVLTSLVPEFGKKRVPPISYVTAFDFITQDGEHFTQDDVEGKVFVSEYFFTTCKGICPVMNGNMKTVYEALKDEPDFLILSHTSDPEVDSAARLKWYADSMKVDTKKWVFLTGRKDSLYNMARLSYTIDDPHNNVGNIEDDFLHTQFWALVDRKGNVRKIYDGLKQSEVRSLINDAKRMLEEEETPEN